MGYFRLMGKYLLICILLCIGISGCVDPSGKSDQLISTSELLLARNPDSAIVFLDSTTRISGKSSPNSSTRIKLLLTLQQAYAGKRLMDSVLSTGIRIRSLAEETGDSLSMARSLLPVRGEVSMADQQALEPYLPGAARIFKTNGLTYEEAVIEGLTGAVGIRRGDFAGSMPHLYHARDILEGLDSIRPLYSVYMNIGNGRSAMQDQRGAIEFFGKATGVARQLNDSVRIASALMNEGIAFSYMQIFDSSRLRFNEGLNVLPSRGGEFAKMQLLYNLAALSEGEGLLSAAESDYRRVLEGAKAMGDPMAIGMANGGIAGVMSRSGRLDQAIKLMEGTVRQLDSIGLGHYAIEHTNMLVSLYKKAGRSGEALTAMEHLKKLSDSLLSADKQKAVQELEAKYRFDKQEDEKKDLHQELRMNRIIIAAIALAAIMLLIFGILLRQRNRFQQEMIRSYERSLVRYRQERDAIHQATGHTNRPMPDGKIDDPSDDTDVDDDQGPDNQQNYEPTDEDKLDFEGVLKYFFEQKPYLNPRLKVDDVSDALAIPDRKISLLIRVFSGQPFNQFVNRYRIDEATRMMEDPETRYWKIDIIAEKSGFSSRQQFRRVFEQVTGVNPGFYRSRING